MACNSINQSYGNHNKQQCQEEAAAAFPIDDADEGCNIHGSLLLTQVGPSVRLSRKTNHLP